jgi:hypothetical protein
MCRNPLKQGTVLRLEHPGQINVPCDGWSKLTQMTPPPSTIPVQSTAHDRGDSIKKGVPNEEIDLPGVRPGILSSSIGVCVDVLINATWKILVFYLTWNLR